MPKFWRPSPPCYGQGKKVTVKRSLRWKKQMQMPWVTYTVNPAYRVHTSIFLNLKCFPNRSISLSCAVRHAGRLHINRPHINDECSYDVYVITLANYDLKHLQPKVECIGVLRYPSKDCHGALQAMHRECMPSVSI